MTLTNDEIFSVNIDSSEEFKNEQFASLTLNTLGIAGTTIKGPAFVPKNIQVFESNSSRTGVLNTFEDTFGKTNEMTSYNNTIAAVSEWFTQGGEQVNFTRVLGIGKSGIPDALGIVSGSGFIVGQNIVSGSSDPGFKASNPASGGTDAGKTLFISSTFKEKTYNNAASPSDIIKISSFDDFLSQEGLFSNSQELFTHVVFCTSGSNLLIGREIDSPIEVENLSEASYRTLFDFSDNKRYIDNNRKNNFSEAYLNTEPRHVLTKGHLVYSKFLPHSALINKKLNLIINNNTFHKISSSDDAEPNLSYENFTSPFKTAKTPWVTSQILNRKDLDNKRDDIIDKCKKLFRFHALDDGEAGNNFKITITPLRIGDSKNKTWSKFSIEISIYSKKNNKFITKLSYSNLTLDPNSKKYICRVFGTEYSYYDFLTEKVITTGIYPQKNNFLRVEVNSEIEFEDLNIHELIPCGFLPYPAFNASNLGNVKKFPLLYTKNLSRSSRSLEILSKRSSWGVNFNDFKISEDENVIFQNGLRCSFEVSQHVESPEDNVSVYYDHTKYYQDNFINASHNIWSYDLTTDQSKRDFFHLEKIIYPTKRVENRFTNWLYAIYRKDGKEISSIDSIHGNSNPLEYEYINAESMLKSSSGASSNNSQFLSFSFFTYGGFDGTNILDFDKHRMNQNAFIKELENEEQDPDYLNNSPMPTYSAYKLANKIITDDSNCEIDILSFPEVGHGIFNKSISDEAGENRRYLAVLNVPEFNSSEIIKDFEFYDLDFSEPSLNDQQSLREGIREDLKNGTNSSLNDMSQRFFNNRFTVNVCNTSEGIVNLDNIAHKRFVVHPATLLIRSFSSSIRFPADSLNTFSDSNISYSTIYNSTFNDSGNNDFSRVVDNALPFNLNYIVSKRNVLNVNSSNTSVSRRNSLTRFSHNTRIMLDIKKNIKYLLYTNDILFNNNSKLKTINIILNRDLTSLLGSYVESGMIKDFYVKLGTGNTFSEKQDNLNNILSSKIAISLFGKDRDNIEEIRLDELVNITKNNLTQTADRDIVLTRI